MAVLTGRNCLRSLKFGTDDSVKASVYKAEKPFVSFLTTGADTEVAENTLALIPLNGD